MNAMQRDLQSKVTISTAQAKAIQDAVKGRSEAICDAKGLSYERSGKALRAAIYRDFCKEFAVASRHRSPPRTNSVRRSSSSKNGRVCRLSVVSERKRRKAMLKRGTPVVAVISNYAICTMVFSPRIGTNGQGSSRSSRSRRLSNTRSRRLSSGLKTQTITRRSGRGKAIDSLLFRYAQRRKRRKITRIHSGGRGCSPINMQSSTGREDCMAILARHAQGIYDRRRSTADH